MKLPKTFIPNNSLEKKTEELLKKKYKPKRYEIDSEAEKLFPSFVEHLKRHYKTLTIYKAQDVPVHVWKITIPDEEPTAFEDTRVIGGIAGYKNEHSGAIEHGYHVVVELEGANVELRYRECYKYLDDKNKKHVKRMLPLRYDDEKEVPFP